MRRHCAARHQLFRNTGTTWLAKSSNPGYPVTISYELEAYSQTLEKVVQALSEWGKMHRENVRQNYKDQKK